jgi:3-deoxy-D-manno-octulosonic acid (KDO) 8-phosphate synthase
MNSVGEVNLDALLGSNIVEGAQHQRRGAKTLEKVCSNTRLVFHSSIDRAHRQTSHYDGRLTNMILFVV